MNKGMGSQRKVEGENHPVFESLCASNPPLLGKEGNKIAKQEHHSLPGKEKGVPIF